MKKIVITIIITAVIVAGGFGIYIYSTRKHNTVSTKPVTTKTQIEKNTTKTEGVNYNNCTYKEINIQGIYMEIPTIFSETENNQNQYTYKTKDNKSKITVEMIQGKNMDDYYNNQLQNESNISYKYLGKNTYSLSWLVGNQEYYQAGINYNSEIVVFTISYPKEEESNFDVIVDKIYKTFIKNQTNSSEAENNNSNSTGNNLKVENNTFDLTGNKAEEIVEQYLKDKNQWGPQKIVNNQGTYVDGFSVSAVDASTLQSFGNGQFAQEILSAPQKYNIEYTQSATQGNFTHSNLLGSFYVTTNAIYQLNIMKGDVLEKVATINNGNINIL